MTKEDFRILLVDDLEMIRSIVRMELLRLGYLQVDEADNGKTAFDILEMALVEGKPYSIIVSDWSMPICNGYQLLNKIRKNPHLARLPFIMLTAEAELGAVTQAMEAGATDYLVKPVSSDALAKKMGLILEKISKKTA